MTIRFEEVRYGFNYGSAEVTRCMSDEKAGWVYLDVKTPRDAIQIYVTKTGKIRVWRVGKGEMK
jgi:hypothetical protein